LPREVFHGLGRDTLEIRGVSAQFSIGEQLLDGLVGSRKYRGKIFVADFIPINSNALVYFFQMRRGIEASPQPGVSQDRFQERGSRPFAIRARDMSARISAAGMTQAFIEDRYIFQIEFGRRGLRRCG
jgi:hypothetical protein